MAITQLSPSATPGKRYSFSAKDEAAPEAGPHTGTFTELSVTATPGPIHSFSAKDAAAPVAGPHTGLFTELSVLALPGQRHSFSAKTEAEIVIPPSIPIDIEPAAPTGSPGLTLQPDYRPGKKLKSRVLKEDDELMELAAYIVASGILE